MLLPGITIAWANTFVALITVASAGDGWTITYEAIGKAEASYSGTKGQQVLYAREISGCKGKMHAGFYLQYRKTHLAAMKPVVEKLVAGLTQQTCS